MKKYKYSCSTFYFLQLESGLLPIPERCSMKVFPAVEGDLAKVKNKTYTFNGIEWVEQIKDNK